MESASDQSFTLLFPVYSIYQRNVCKHISPSRFMFPLLFFFFFLLSNFQFVEPNCLSKPTSYCGVNPLHAWIIEFSELQFSSAAHMEGPL